MKISFARTLCIVAAMTSSPALAAPCDGFIPAEKTKAVSRSIRAEDLARLRDTDSVAVSPDGTQVAFELRRGDPATNSYCTAMVVMGVHGGGKSLSVVDFASEPRPDRYVNFGMIDFPGGGWSANRPKWSPDGKWIAYLKRVGGIDQLWRAETGGANARAVVAADVDVLDFAWSPEGSALAFTSRPGMVAFQASVEAEALRGYLYDERFAPGVSKKPFARDLPVETQRVDLADGRIHAATKQEAAWFRPSEVAKPGMGLWAKAQDGGLAWFAMTTTAWPAYRNTATALVVSNGDGERQCSAMVCQGSPSAIWWKGKAAVQFVRREGVLNNETAVYEWKTGEAKPQRKLLTRDWLEDCQPTVDEVICLHESSTTPRRIVAVSKATMKMRTVFDPNPEFQTIALQPAKRLYWRSAQGLDAYGDLILPAGHRHGQKHPLIIVGYNAVRGFHRGGIADEYPIQIFAANGFAVLSYARPNPPSGTDLATGFKAAMNNWTDRRRVQEVLEAGLDAALATGTIDAERVAITGLSDAAMTAAWALLNSDRFSAASVSSLISRNGFLAIGGPARATEFRRAGLINLPLEKGIEFWKSVSIAENPEKVRVPLLVQVSDDELASGVDSYEVLREQNRPVELYVYPGEHHNKWQPSHRLALYKRNLQWFDFWLRGVRHADPLDPEQYDRWERLKAGARDAP